MADANAINSIFRALPCPAFTLPCLVPCIQLHACKVLYCCTYCSTALLHTRERPEFVLPHSSVLLGTPRAVIYRPVILWSGTSLGLTGQGSLWDRDQIRLPKQLLLCCTVPTGRAVRVHDAAV